MKQKKRKKRKKKLKKKNSISSNQKRIALTNKGSNQIENTMINIAFMSSLIPTNSHHEKKNKSIVPLAENLTMLKNTKP